MELCRTFLPCPFIQVADNNNLLKSVCLPSPPSSKGKPDIAGVRTGAGQRKHTGRLIVSIIIFLNYFNSLIPVLVASSDITTSAHFSPIGEASRGNLALSAYCAAGFIPVFAGNLASVRPNSRSRRIGILDHLIVLCGDCSYPPNPPYRSAPRATIVPETSAPLRPLLTPNDHFPILAVVPTHQPNGLRLIALLLPPATSSSCQRPPPSFTTAAGLSRRSSYRSSVISRRELRGS